MSSVQIEQKSYAPARRVLSLYTSRPCAHLTQRSGLDSDNLVTLGEAGGQLPAVCRFVFVFFTKRCRSMGDTRTPPFSTSAPAMPR